MAIEALGKYPLEAEIGRGGMGVVYKGKDPDTGIVVAIKMLPEHLASDPLFITRFRREVVTLQRIRHSGVVTIYDHGQQDGNHFYVMEYVGGGSLEGKLKAETLSPVAATDLALSISRALEHLHANGIIHRDLKPANVLMTSDGQTKLTDFGVAKLVDATRMTVTQSILGTVEYMSPEQSQGRHVDARTDIYSLGVIYYRAVTGRLPITGSNMTEVMMKLRTHQVEHPSELKPEIPQYVGDLIMKMLAKDPTVRVPHAKALTQELERVRERLLEHEHRQAQLAAQGEVLRSARTLSGKSYPAYRHPVVIGAVLVVVMGIILGYFLLRTTDLRVRLDNAKAQLAKDDPEAEYWARQELRAIVNESPSGSVAGEAKELLRQLESKNKDVANARLLFWVANGLEARSRADAAKDVYRLLAQHFPDTEFGKRAGNRLKAIERPQAEKDAPQTQEQMRSDSHEDDKGGRK